MRFLLISLLLSATALAQTPTHPAEQAVYRNSEIGFSFTPPSGLMDVTARAKSSADNDPNAVQLRLFELSGPDSNDLNWRGVAIQSYPRARAATKDDFAAEQKFSRTIIGDQPKETAAASPETIAGLPFAVCQYQSDHGLLIQYSRVYTTVIHGQLVAFAFTANSTANLDEMAQSLKTIHVTEEKPVQ